MFDSLTTRQVYAAKYCNNANEDILKANVFLAGLKARHFECDQPVVILLNGRRDAPSTYKSLMHKHKHIYFLCSRLSCKTRLQDKEHSHFMHYSFQYHLPTYRFERVEGSPCDKKRWSCQCNVMRQASSNQTKKKTSQTAISIGTRTDST